MASLLRQEDASEQESNKKKDTASVKVGHASSDVAVRGIPAECIRRIRSASVEAVLAVPRHIKFHTGTEVIQRGKSRPRDDKEEPSTRRSGQIG
ncbi:hypothetical protein PROFUN_09330 [Planoprotostelium fungivorum]|uniref:Uncharacterized protein n=1 Tax=Planoprotostelium fungivorum TaxID=1890364 RepID=A0A2P6NHC3_9EUKA|nr:hypothetical protein PROFUN_09330 [Planoprotostelium fungivorum]